MTQDDLIGKRIGGYEILDKIGQGGMATVYRAHQISMNRPVAIKILPRQFLSDDSYMQRFNREVKIVSQLEHRSIVPVYDYGEHEGLPFIVMRYMTAGSVDDLLRKNGPMDADKILQVIEQIAPALDYAHTKGVLHRDLKPSNVLMDDDGGAYITDFGIARILGETGPGITTQGVVGTPSYMSPEQAQGHGLDGRSDVYSLGVMMFEMATGRRPFQSDTPYSIAVMQVTTPPPAPRVLNPNITPKFEAVIYKSLEKKPEHRYTTGATLVDGLRSAISKAKTHDTQPGGVPIPQRQDVGMQSAPPVSPPPSPPVSNPPPSSAPVQPVYQESFAPSGTYTPQAPINYRPQPRKKRSNGILESFAIGGLLGCGLLVALGIVGVIIIFLVWSNLNSQSSITSTNVPTIETDIETGGGLPTLDSFSATARSTLVGGTDEIDPTDDVAPVGVRPTLTIDPSRGMGDDILFFTRRDDNYNIYRININSGAETQLTLDDDDDTYPSVSPDGSMVAFQSNRGGNYDIYTMTIHGGDVRRLTDNRMVDRVPVWSPDGAWLIYSSDTNINGYYDLYIMRPDGSDNRLFFGNGQRNSVARWSPDGSYIVFTTGDLNAATWEIGRLNISYDENGIPQADDFIQLTNNDYEDQSPFVSPDGNTIAYITDGIGGGAVAVMNADGSDAHIIYDGSGDEWGATFSLDGQKIAFNSNMDRVSGDDEIYIMNADGSDVEQLTENGAYFPSFIP
jgi:serine/threonine protein kinase/Tol biopolymer transport system component